MPVADVAKEFNLAVDEAEELLKLAKEKLWNYREEKRAKPHCDDKVSCLYMQPRPCNGY